MLARVVELNVVPDKLETLRTIITNEVLPLIKKNTGFVDTLGLVDSTTPTTLLTILMFKTKNDIERYERDTLPTVMQKIRPYLTNNPNVRTCQVETSTFHRITAGMAA